MTMTVIRLLDLSAIRDAIPHGRQKEVAEAIGVHLNTLSRKLNGHVSLSMNEINMIAKLLAIGVDQFLRLEELEEVEPDRP